MQIASDNVMITTAIKIFDDTTDFDQTVDSLETWLR